MIRAAKVTIGMLAAMGLAGTAMAQVSTIDPNQAGQLAARPATSASAPASAARQDPPAADAVSAQAGDAAASGQSAPAPPPPSGPVPASESVGTTPMGRAASEASAGATYQEKDIFEAAEGVFGKGAEGLAKVIERIIGDNGRPVAYIAGREAGGAFIAGLRYGSGTMFHKVEGQRPVYWTGPSLGFDIGANGAKTFVLVYNLYDSQELYQRFPAGEGAAYLVGGFNASYLRRGDIVLIPIRLGVGWRLGVNVGYMNFTEKGRWLPF
ncbi:DUF1134 domain-containing protein [Sphingomonas naphthae]|uniref:DUF1134 domain-containing protein n=1 Tax=Sphingomonas naphthae TaxID=1813468 RepID=A0ABY7TGQ7_9SPHN|nr:DUF1134 domain-containing protein [Sphingomonas naphthae]WCT72156.1 DUF1134 domain-containing protein [Sphingomonas naphthae]